MDYGLPLALLGMGLASGVHCLGMCGGIVTAFSTPRLFSREEILLRQSLFNLGRVASYAAAGAVAHREPASVRRPAERAGTRTGRRREASLGGSAIRPHHVGPVFPQECDPGAVRRPVRAYRLH